MEEDLVPKLKNFVVLLLLPFSVRLSTAYKFFYFTTFSYGGTEIKDTDTDTDTDTERSLLILDNIHFVILKNL